MRPVGDFYATQNRTDSRSPNRPSAGPVGLPEAVEHPILGTLVAGAPMADPLDRLKAALANRYAIQRELGSGGMGTVGSRGQ